MQPAQQRLSCPLSSPGNSGVHVPCVSTACWASVCAARATVFYCSWHWGNIITWQLPMCPLGLIHCRRVRGLTRAKTALHQAGSERTLARSWQLSNMQTFLCLFICFLMTPGSSRQGIFSIFFFPPSVKKNKTTTTRSFFLLIVCHWPIKVKDRSNFEWKVFPTLEMDAFESLPFNTNKCSGHSCPVWHTYTNTLSVPLPIHLLLPPLCSSPALIRVMPTHHSTMG